MLLIFLLAKLKSPDNENFKKYCNRFVILVVIPRLTVKVTERFIQHFLTLFELFETFTNKCSIPTKNHPDATRNSCSTIMETLEATVIGM